MEFEKKYTKLLNLIKIDLSSILSVLNMTISMLNVEISYRFQFLSPTFSLEPCVSFKKYDDL